jgi:magnesium-transporting ATPase (P-type)
MIYQLYNITMTSLPIMYFALFDFEHEKDVDPIRPRDLKSNVTRYVFMKHPHLYKIGINNQCFSITHFLRWMLYGLVHACMVYMFVFHFLLIPGQTLTSGKDIGFWAMGHVVYGTCVMVANLVMIFKFNNYTGWGEILCIASMLCFFTLYFLENLLTMFPQVYLVFDTTFV